jgi:nitrite reductase/ring-hydroxylating ferredoxin subunit
MHLTLAKFVTPLRLQTHSHQRWAVLGPEAEAFKANLYPAKIEHDSMEQLTVGLPELDGLLLAGALSTVGAAPAWLQQLAKPLKVGATLVVLDWQADGPLDVGPELDRRFKRGRLYRLLREAGFGFIETLESQPVYYLVRAVKRPPDPLPHAGEFVVVADLAELPKNGMKRVELFGHKIIVANTGKEIVAFAQTCPHAGSPLDKGKLRGRNIICPLHFYIWDVCTGEPVEPEGEDTLPRYPVRVDPERGQVLIALTP